MMLSYKWTLQRAIVAEVNKKYNQLIGVQSKSRTTQLSLIQMLHKSMAVISDEPKHDAETLFAILQKTMPYVM